MPVNANQRKSSVSIKSSTAFIRLQDYAPAVAMLNRNQKRGVKIMAIRTKEELLTLVSGRLGETPSDDDLSFLEDISDTLADLEASAKGNTDWKAKYDELDSTWRKRYVNRFTVADGDAAITNLEQVSTPSDGYSRAPAPTSFSELFKEE